MYDFRVRDDRTSQTLDILLAYLHIKKATDIPLRQFATWVLSDTCITLYHPQPIIYKDRLRPHLVLYNSKTYLPHLRNGDGARRL